MRLPPLFVVVPAVAGLVGCGGTARVVTTAAPPVTVPVPTTPTVTLPVVTAPVPNATAERYRADVGEALTALTGFSSRLSGIRRADEFRSGLTALRGRLRRFDAAVRRLRGYRVDDPALDSQRARLARRGPPLARAMSDFLDALRDGDADLARRLAGEVQRRLTAFRAAA